MGDVVEFVEVEREDAEPELWQCNCGCLTFRLYSNGNVECPKCDTVSVEKRCFWRDPDE